MDDRLKDRHFVEIAHLVESYSGIRLPPVKRIMIEGRLRRRMRALGLSSLADYGAEIFDRGRLEEEFVHVVDCATTNKTDFFRESEHFVFLADQAIPALSALPGRRGAPIKFWSAAASIGAEAYSIAMVAAEKLGLEGTRFAILGTDISREVLMSARHGVYPLELAEPIPALLRARYLMLARDPRRREFRIVPELRRRVHFERMNLMDETYPVDTAFDVILCRNVLIYFSKGNCPGRLISS